MKAKWTIVLALLITTLGGCSSSTASGSSTDGGTIDLTSARHDPEAMTVAGWLNPKTLQVQPLTVEPEEGDMLIRGELRGWHFTPTGNIEGALHEVPSRATPDRCWLVLSDRTVIYQDEEGATAPDEPHLDGRFDAESALFYPSSTIVLGR